MMVNKTSFKFHRNLIFVGMILASLTLVSCSTSGSEDGSRGTVVELDYSSISAGPKITAFEIGPSIGLTEYGEFYASVKLENQGSQDLSSGEIIVSAAADSKLIEWNNQKTSQIELQGYNLENVAVDFEIFNFEGLINEIPIEMSEMPVTFFVEANFRYTTELEQEVCINPSTFENVHGNCENPTSTVFAESQYSPVVIRNFEQEVSGLFGKAYFTFHIENQGEGKIEEISLAHAQLTSEEMNCKFITGEGEANGNIYTFANGEKTVDLLCDYNFDPNSAAFEKILYLDFSYDYSLQEQERVVIRSAIG